MASVAGHVTYAGRRPWCVRLRTRLSVMASPAIGEAGSPILVVGLVKVLAALGRLFSFPPSQLVVPKGLHRVEARAHWEGGREARHPTRNPEHASNRLGWWWWVPRGGCIACSPVGRSVASARAGY